MKDSEPFDRYRILVSPARDRILKDLQISKIISQNYESDFVLLFLIYFSALGIEMTRPVDQWISRAGIRCKECGHEDLGIMLMKHAAHERGHHEMLERDLDKLIDVWNESHSTKWDSGAFRSIPVTPAMHRYIAIHESTILGDKPFGQLAIEYEIEGMSLVLGPALIRVCDSSIGSICGLSFIQEHSLLDIGHTAMNEAQLIKFLDQHPDEAESMAKVGAEALHIYLDFLGECVEVTELYFRS